MGEEHRFTGLQSVVEQKKYDTMVEEYDKILEEANLNIIGGDNTNLYTTIRTITSRVSIVHVLTFVQPYAQ